MVRPAECHFTNQASANLEFLVLDELHTHRGRQGADVAMRVRRCLGRGPGAAPGTGSRRQRCPSTSAAPHRCVSP
jgi:ATP-dependent helicase YprA (DUF1998 family)